MVEALAVTACAQIAVAPLLVWRFEGLPVASLPANLLAGPAAGPVMMWGLMGGLVVVLGHPAVVMATMPDGTHMIDADSVIWRDNDVTVVQVAGRAQPEQVLSTLRKANVDAIDLVIVERSSFENTSLVGWLRTHYQVRVVRAPAVTMAVGEVVPDDGTRRHTTARRRCHPDRAPRRQPTRGNRRHRR